MEITAKTTQKSEEAWTKAKKEIEDAAARKAEEANRKIHKADKSLYEMLEANKAAKQEAFEEATRLRNQFRALDEDEVDFLDSVLECTRAHEAKVHAETVQGLQSFRRRQAEEDQKVLSEVDTLLSVNNDVGDGGGEKSSWVVSSSGCRKRKRARVSKIGLVTRKISDNSSVIDKEILANNPNNASKEITKFDTLPKIHSKSEGPLLPPIVASKSALVNYGSDED